MGRPVNPIAPVVGASVAEQNPVSGVFGSGNVLFITANQSWTPPPGVFNVRARMWGAGSGRGLPGGTTSFGSFCSATGGSADGKTGGNGVGGDINHKGGNSPGGYGGGGSASLIGDGGSNWVGAYTQGGVNYPDIPPVPATGGAGYGGGGPNAVTSPTLSGGHGYTGKGGNAGYGNANAYTPTMGQAGEPGLSHILDFIGTGGGGGGANLNASQNTAYANLPAGHGNNGGGGGFYATGNSNGLPWCGAGGFPGGGYGNSGAGAGFAMKVCNVTPGTAITCTVGAAPAGAGAGLIVLEW